MGSSVELERIGVSSVWRGIVAGLLGCLLWVNVMVAVITAAGPAEGEAPSVVEIVILMLVSASVTAAPCVASQMTRGRWSLEESGVRERIKPLVSFLPLGLNRDRLVRWQDIESFGVEEIRMRGGRVLHYFRARIPGRPLIEIPRKESKPDPAFDEFVTEFSQRMAQ